MIIIKYNKRNSINIKSFFDIKLTVFYNFQNYFFLNIFNLLFKINYQFQEKNFIKLNSNYFQVSVYHYPINFKLEKI